jgi:hypothetical protein
LYSSVPGNARSLLLEEIDGEPLIFMPHLRRAEDGIAVKIRRLPPYPLNVPFRVENSF